jgi:hypothetical protein
LSPAALDAIVFEQRLDAQDGHSVHESLRDQEPVERILVVERELCDALDMSGYHREQKGM